VIGPPQACDSGAQEQAPLSQESTGCPSPGPQMILA